MKFGRLIEYKTSNDFFVKSYAKCDGDKKLIPNPFIQN